MFCPYYYRQGVSGYTRRVLHGIRDGEWKAHYYQELDVDNIEHTEVREFGGEWICKQCFEELGLSRYLEELGWEERWIKVAMIYMIARALFPASDRKTEDWLKINSSLTGLYGIEPERVIRHHLYKASRKLYEKIKRRLRSG